MSAAADADTRPWHWLSRLLAAPRWRIGLGVVVGLAVIFRIAQVAVASQGRAWGYDFAAYWHAAQRVLDGQPIYTAAQLAGTFSPQEQGAYLYPPLLAAALTPLPLIFEDPRGAMWLWAGLGLAVLIVSVTAMSRREGLGWPVIGLLVGAAVALPPVGFELVMGNVHLLLVGLLAGAWLGLRGGSRAGALAAGALIGVAALIKVFPLLIVLWLLLARRQLAALGAVGAIVALALLSLPVVGLSAWLDYPRVLANLGPPPELWSSVAPVAALAEVVDFAVARLVIAAVGLGLVVWSALRQPAPISFAVAVMVSMLAVPTIYVHYLALAVVPLLLLTLHGRSAIAAALAYIVLMVGSQLALVELQPVAFRALALAGTLAPLVALLLARGQAAWPTPVRAAAVAAPTS
jgi:hypothetical protein